MDSEKITEGKSQKKEGRLRHSLKSGGGIIKIEEDSLDELPARRHSAVESDSDSCEFEFPGNPHKKLKTTLYVTPLISSYPPASKSSLLATVILYIYQDTFHTPISLQEFIFDFK